MRRREFCELGGAAVLSMLLPGGRVLADSAGPVVWEVEGSATSAMGAVFEAPGGVESLLPVKPERATVLIKPNICLPQPSENATTTTPEVLRALCQHLVDRGIGRIIVAEHTLQYPAERFEGMELTQVAAEFPGAKFLLANEQRYYAPVQVDGKVLKTTETLKLLSRADLFVNLPTAKHHSAANVSLATKNLMGLIWDRTAFHTELDLGQAIGDLGLAIRPQVNIVDATRVLLNGGPTGPGPIITENRLFASTDMVAVDSVVASRYSFGGRKVLPARVAHLRAAYDNGIGEIRPGKIELKKLSA